MASLHPHQPTSIQIFLRRALETTWLAAAFLIPLMIMHEGFMLGYIQVAKVSVARSLGLLLVALYAFDWALDTSRRSVGTQNGRSLVTDAWRRIRTAPERWVIYSIAAVLIANVISLTFSPVKSIGWDGIDVGWDTYGLYSILTYLAFCVVLVVKLRSRRQIERLIWTIITASVLSSVYGIGQHFGVDFLVSDASPVSRAGLTFGNPIFGPAYLVMTIPLVFAVIMPYRNRMPAFTHIWIGGGLLATQIAAIVFSQSRGPLIGLIVGILALLAVVAWVQGARHAIRPAAMVLVAIVFTTLMNSLPVVNESTSRSLGERVLEFGPGAAGGTQNRLWIWETSIEVFTETPWPDADQAPDIPNLSMRFLRPIVGYGPDMFAYAYPLAGDTDYTSQLASHGHNFIVHTAIELGLLGVSAYMALLAAVGALLFRLSTRARTGAYPDWFAYLVIGLTAAMAARVAEQLSGKAQISDLHLMWMLIALVVTLSVIASSQEPKSADATAEPSNRKERRRREHKDVGGSVIGTIRIPLVFASVIAICTGVLWTQTVANVFRSNMVIADAREMAAAGNSQQAVQLFRKAIDLAPNSAVAKLNLSALFSKAGEQEERSKESRIKHLQLADDLLLAILERNPLNHSAWTRHRETLRKIAKLDPTRIKDAVLAAETHVNLMPGYWQTRMGLAHSLVTIGLYDAGLEVVQEAKDIHILETPGAAFIYSIEASAYEGLGRFDEAIETAHCSLAHKQSTEPIALLDRLGAPVGTGFTLTSSEAERCPEVVAKRN